MRARAEASRAGTAAGPATPVHERKEADRVGGAAWPITPVRVRVEAYGTHAGASERDALLHTSGVARTAGVGGTAPYTAEHARVLEGGTSSEAGGATPERVRAVRCGCD